MLLTAVQRRMRGKTGAAAPDCAGFDHASAAKECGVHGPLYVCGREQHSKRKTNSVISLCVFTCSICAIKPSHSRVLQVCHHVHAAQGARMQSWPRGRCGDGRRKVTDDARPEL